MLVDSTKFTLQLPELRLIYHLLVIISNLIWSPYLPQVESALQCLNNLVWHWLMLVFLHFLASEKLLGVWREMEQTAASCGQVELSVYLCVCVRVSK